MDGLRRASQAVDLSPEGATQQAALYQDNLAHYRLHVRKSLDEGDYRQVAEKSWGAYAQIVKAISAERQYIVPYHGAIVSVADRLASLVGTSDPAAGQILRQGLSMALSLHQHFYENNLSRETVTANAGDVATAIDMLQEIFPQKLNAQ